MMRLFILLGIVIVIAAILFGGVFAYDTFYPKYVAYKEQKAAEEAERIRQCKQPLSADSRAAFPGQSGPY